MRLLEGIVTTTTDPFAVAMPGLFQGAFLAEVVSVKDPQRLARVQVRLLNCDGPSDQDGPMWADVAVPFAGSKRGAFLIPDVGDTVLVTFVQGDSRHPVVLGGLWHGRAAPPETLGGGGSRVDRWTLVGKAGTRIAIVEESGQPKITFETPGGQKVELRDGPGTIKVSDANGNSITLESAGITIKAAAQVKVNAPMVQVTSGMVKVDAGISMFSGVVQCDVLISNAVVSASYTPGVGNVW